MAAEAREAPVRGRTVIRGIGMLLSGDLGAPVLEADCIILTDGRISAVGNASALDTGGADAETFQPMNINFGLFPPLAEAPKGRERKRAYCERALHAADAWLGRPHTLPAPRAVA